MEKNRYHQELKRLIDEYVNFVYDVTTKFPKEELFGVVSQFRRSGLSVALNYIEGYARNRKAHLKNFLEIAYGSLQESKYLVEFSYKRSYITQKEFEKGKELSENIGKMLWGIISKL